MRKFIKYWGVSVILIFATFLPFQAYTFQNSKKPADIDWEAIESLRGKLLPSMPVRPVSRHFGCSETSACDRFT
jgi:hypothetical protein